MTEHEQAIAAAAYLKGCFIALVVDRTDPWKRRLVKRSWIPRSDALVHALQILDGGAFTPLHVYDVIEAAKALGFDDKDVQIARSAIGQALTETRAPGFYHSSLQRSPYE